MKNTTSKQKLIILCECAILVALSTVLSTVCKIWESPLGGSVTLLSMLPIMLISMRHGLKWGFGSAFVYSVIQLITGLNSFSYIPTTIGVICSVVFDYIVPFTALGIAGIFIKDTYQSKKSEFLRIIAGMALAICIRFLSHFFVGSLLWYEITKEGQWNDYVNKYGMWMYSFIYQLLYLGPDSLLVFIVSPVVPKLYRVRLTK